MNESKMIFFEINIDYVLAIWYSIVINKRENKKEDPYEKCGAFWRSYAQDGGVSGSGVK
ncbi:MAG: hypothetical protein HFG72_07325 [Hungatella sp.]|jgi:hypothetical protein|nr:hypothetical protein [Hungatella sp.]